MEAVHEEANNKPITEICSLLAIDPTNLFYTVCSVCESTLPENSNDNNNKSNNLCNHYHHHHHHPSISTSTPSKRLFRVLMSIATDQKVFTVVCFDRVARVLFGCSADEFFDFAKLHPFSSVTANEILEGELFRMTLSKPKNGNAQHLRVTSLVPLSSCFRPVIEVLKELYKVEH